MRGLYDKIDQIAASAQAPGDPMAFKQLEQAVVSLRGVVSNVASDGALAQLAAEVRGLAAQFERATADSSTEALAKLEARIGALMESGRAVPPELEGSIRALSERLDRMQLSQGDQLALGALEDRIAKLSEKLDASDCAARPPRRDRARLGRPAGLSRGDAKRRTARLSRAASGRARSRAGSAAAPDGPCPGGGAGDAGRSARLCPIAARPHSGTAASGATGADAGADAVRARRGLCVISPVGARGDRDDATAAVRAAAAGAATDAAAWPATPDRPEPAA